MPKRTATPAPKARKKRPRVPQRATEPDRTQGKVDRIWAMSGLAFALGTAFGAAAVGAREDELPGRKITGSSRLLLIGDGLAEGLAPHFRRMARDARVAFDVATVQGSARDLCTNRSIELATSYPHDLVLVACPIDEGATLWMGPELRALCDHVAEPRGTPPVRARIAWALPEPPALRVRRMLLEAGCKVLPAPPPLERGPAGYPTALGFAAWAGALWGWLV